MDMRCIQYMGAGHLSLYLDHAVKGTGRIEGKKMQSSLKTRKIQYKFNFFDKNPCYPPVMLNNT